MSWISLHAYHSESTAAIASQSLQPNQSQMNRKCYFWKPCRDQGWQRFFLAICYLSVLLTTTHNSILKICPKYQVLSSHFSEVNELLNVHWAKIVLSENISTPINVQCKNIYQEMVCCQEFWYVVSGLDIQLEQFKNNNPVGIKWVQSCKVLQVINLFLTRLIQTYSLVVKASLNE